MRHIYLIVLALLCPALALAQDASPSGQSSQSPAPAAAAASSESADLPDFRTANFVDLGLRGTAFASGSDEARFERYRDLRNGPTADVARFSHETDRYLFTAQAEHVGYRDQRYTASYTNFGKLKVTFEWDQIPLFFSQDTQTLYTSPSPGVLTINPAIRSGIQNSTLTLAQAVTQAQPFDLKLRRDILAVNLTYSPTPTIDWKVSLTNQSKNGNQPWAGTFGFSNAVELPVPVDTRQTEIKTDLEWSSDRGMARIGYDGSFFRNNISTLVWDNPLRLTDSSTAGPAQGRMSLWPDSNMNAVTAAGAWNLPARSRAVGYISVANWSQNDPLIPFTINSALPVIPLDRTTAEADARVTAMTYDFTSKPTNLLYFNARYRLYDYDNRTPLFNVPQTVAYDTTVEPYALGTNSPYSVKRQSFDVDGSWTATRYTAIRLGYTREVVDETFRTFDSTTLNTFKVSLDTTRYKWLTARLLYQHDKRVGTGLDEQSLDDIGEQVSLRQFDISDLTGNSFSGIVQVMPFSTLSFNGTVTLGNEDRPGTTFGLRSNTNHIFSIGADYVPRDAVSFGILYELEKYDALQASRQANPGPQFDDPTRDWTTDGADTAHTLTASLDLLKLFPRTDVRMAYELSHAQSVYIYGLAPNTTLPPVQQLPPVLNEFQRATVDVRHYLNRRWSIGGYYWFEKYRVNDFATSPETLNTLAQPSFLILGYVYRPYTANTVSGRVTYVW